MFMIELLRKNELYFIENKVSFIIILYFEFEYLPFFFISRNRSEQCAYSSISFGYILHAVLLLLLCCARFIVQLREVFQIFL